MSNIPTPQDLERQMEADRQKSVEEHKRGRKAKVVAEEPLEYIPDSDLPDMPVAPKSKYARREIEDVTFKLVGKFRQNEHGQTVYPIHMIDNQDTVFDPEIGTIRRIRLLRGVDTIFVEDQQKMGITDEQADTLRVTIVFDDGVLNVPKYNKPMIKFLEMKNCCDNGQRKVGQYKLRYRMIDTDRDQDRALALEESRQKARQIASTATFDELLPHAKYLNVRFTDEYGQDLKESGIRVNYIKMADKMPDEFIRTFYNPSIRLHYRINMAVENGSILIDRNALRAKWKTGATITLYHSTEDPKKYLTDFALSDEGKDFKSQLERLSL